MIFHDQPPTHETCRAEINRRNAQHSTGPRTSEGKARSCQNSFKHGLYSKQLVTPDENPAEFDELRATLRREHQPANTVEDILVDELAQHFWRLRRFREMEGRAWGSDDPTRFITSGYFALVARNLASAERSFFRTLTALTKLQQARGFVPQKPCLESESAPAAELESVENHPDAPGTEANDDATHSLRFPGSHRSRSLRSGETATRIPGPSSPRIPTDTLQI